MKKGFPVGFDQIDEVKVIFCKNNLLIHNQCQHQHKNSCAENDGVAQPLILTEGRGCQASDAVGHHVHKGNDHRQDVSSLGLIIHIIGCPQAEDIGDDDTGHHTNMENNGGLSVNLHRQDAVGHCTAVRPCLFGSLILFSLRSFRNI